MAEGSSSRAMNGTAKYRTDTSMETRSSGSIRTARASHSRRPATAAAAVPASTVSDWDGDKLFMATPFICLCDTLFT